MKTKALVVSDAATSGKTSLEHVDVAVLSAATELSQRDRLFAAIGEAKGHLIHSTLSNLLLAESLRSIKDGAVYKKEGLTWEEVCGVFDISKDTADRMIADLNEFGPLFFKTKAIVRISREAYRRLAPIETEDGRLLIGDDAFALTKANAQSIQAAIQLQNQKFETLQDRVNNAEQSLKAARQERDNAKKAAVDANKKLRDSQNTQPFADVDEDHRTMLRVQSNWDASILMLNKLRARSLSDENQARYIGLCEYLYRSLLQVTDDARFSFGRGPNLPDPSDNLFLSNEPDKSRDLLAEYTKDAAPTVAEFRQVDKHTKGVDPK